MVGLFLCVVLVLVLVLVLLLVLVVVVLVSASCACMSTSHTRATQEKHSWTYCTAWRRGPAHAPNGLSQSEPCPQLKHTDLHPVHPPCLGINVIRTWMFPDSQSLPNTWPRLIPPKNHAQQGVLEFFCLVGLF